MNKSLLVENLATKNLITQRIVYDHKKVNNVSAEDLEICSTLRRNVKHARQRYSTYLEEQKKKKVQNDRSLKEKQESHSRKYNTRTYKMKQTSLL